MNEKELLAPSPEDAMCRGPLDGFRILDLTHVLAGPFATSQLANLGAEVIKVEAPDALDMMRQEGPLSALAEQGMGIHYQSQSAGKKAITLNLKAASGQRIFKLLVQSADVLVANYRRSSQLALGLDSKTLHEHNPRLITCSITGYGQTGPKADHPAYDNVIQAYSGLLKATAHPGSEPCKVGPPVLDYGTGAQAALAITAALMQRELKGVVAELDVAMLDAALMLMSSAVTETSVTGKPPLPHGNSSLAKAGYACFETSAGQLMVGAFTVRQHADLWRSLGQSGRAQETAGLSVAELETRFDADRALLKELFKSSSAEQWEERLNNNGVPAARVRELHETLAEPQLESRSVLQSTHHRSNLESESAPDSNPVRFPGSAWNSDVMPDQLAGDPPLAGQHNHEVLTQLGISRDEMRILEKERVI